jgi:phosphatidylinositol alpha-1,6-mannosyltransferase
VHGEELNVAKTSGLLLWIAKAVFNSADLIIVNSRNTERLLRDINSTTRVEVIHPGVDVKKVNEFSGSREETRKKYRWLHRDFVVLTIARLEPRKNIKSTVDALVRVRAMGHRVRYVIVGQGDGIAELSDHIVSVNGREWITHLPKVTEDEKNQLLNAADLFVLPSIQFGPMIEGFGIVFLEAAAAGLPAISGISGGEREAVINGVSGINVDGSNNDDLTRAIMDMIENSKMRKDYSNGAKAWAAQNDWDFVCEKTKCAVTIG